MEDYTSRGKFTVRKFDINKVRHGEKGHIQPACIVVGKRNTGKTWLVRDLLYQMRDYPNTNVFVREESEKAAYFPMVPADRVQVGWQSIGDIVSRQTAACATEDNSSAVLVLDDCLESQHVFKCPPLRQMMISSRHLKTALITVMQYPIKLQMEMRANADYIFICRTPVMNERRAIYEQFGGMFPSFHIFCDVLDACTGDYNCLVIDNLTASLNIEDMVFWYKAAARGDFIMGSGDAVERADIPKGDDVRMVVFSPPPPLDSETEDDSETEG